MYSPSFPLEIWSQTVSWLPMSDKKSLLGVSRFFHSAALPFVFSSVKIYVLGGYETLQMLDTNNETFAYEVETKLTRRSCEILLHIVASPGFARLVKDMTLVVYTEYPACYEILTLTKALGVLHNLRALRCYGSDLSKHAFEEILQAVPPTIERILYSTIISLDLTANLPNLECLEYRNTMYFPEDGASDLPLSPPPPNNTLTNLNFHSLIHTRLKALAIDAVWVTRIPIWVYNQLVSLEINSDRLAHPINIDFICHHCPILEDLSATGEIWVGLCLSLPAETTFPRLQSLRLSCEGFNGDGDPKAEHFAALSLFLRAHRNLRRLYLRFPDARWCQIRSLLGDIQAFRNLDALGIHAGSDALSEGDLEHLVTHIPLTPKALQLSMAWNTNTGSHVPIIMNALSALPNLQFLHIYGTYSRLPFSPEELALDLKGLRRVGLTRALWDIERNGSEFEGCKWPRWKIKFFSESDFDDADDAWLFKYH